MIRNQLGMKMLSHFDYKSFNFFLDAAYVYEYYFSDPNYKQRFIGSSITQTIPTKNYGRIHTGFQGVYQNFDWKLAYTGLYGKALADSAISIKLGYKF